MAKNYEAGQNSIKKQDFYKNIRKDSDKGGEEGGYYMVIKIISSVQAFQLNAYLEKFVTTAAMNGSFLDEAATFLLEYETEPEDSYVSKLAQSLQKIFTSLELNDVLFIYRGKIPQTVEFKNERTERAVSYLKSMGIKSLINGALKVSTESISEVADHLLWLGKRNGHAIYCGGIGRPFVLGITLHGLVVCFFYSFSETDKFLKNAIEGGFKKKAMVKIRY